MPYQQQSSIRRYSVDLSRQLDFFEEVIPSQFFVDFGVCLVRVSKYHKTLCLIKATIRTCISGAWTKSKHLKQGITVNLGSQTPSFFPADFLSFCLEESFRLLQFILLSPPTIQDLMSRLAASSMRFIDMVNALIILVTVCL